MSVFHPHCVPSSVALSFQVFIAENKAWAFLCVGEMPSRQLQVNSNYSYKRHIIWCTWILGSENRLQWERSMRFSLSIGPVPQLTPFLSWFTPTVHTTDKGQIYKSSLYMSLLSAWINHFHLKAKGLMLWAILRSKAVAYWLSLDPSVD